jgi:phosphoserine phosphatase
MRPAGVCAAPGRGLCQPVVAPLSRHMMTAGIIAQRLWLSVLPMASFLDIDDGDSQDRSHQEVQQADPEGFAWWFDTPHLVVIPGDAMLLQLASCVAETVRSILTRHHGETVMLVGNDSVNRVQWLLSLDPPLSRLLHRRQEPRGINLMTDHNADGGPGLSLNDASHVQSLR